MNKVYQEIAQTFDAYLNCIERRNEEWEAKHKNRIMELVDLYLPRGSGFDTGTHFQFDESTRGRLVFWTEYHHMNENGMYDGWTEHKVILTPSFRDGYDLRITGRDRNDFKEYAYLTFGLAFDEPCPRNPFEEVVLAELSEFRYTAGTPFQFAII